MSMFFHLSESFANFFYWFGALMAVVGGFLALWGDRERDRYSDIRTSELEAKAAEANKQAAILNDRAARAEFALAILESKRQGRWTLLLKNGFTELLKGRPVGTVTIWYVPGNSEALEFAQMLETNLRETGWKVGPAIPIPADVNPGKGQTLFLRATEGMDGGDSIALRPKALTDLEGNTPFGSLHNALTKVGLGAIVSPDPTRPDGDILIVIGVKL